MDVYSRKTFGTEIDFRITNMEHILKTITLIFYQIFFTFGCVTIVTYSSVIMTLIQTHLTWLMLISLFGSFSIIIYMVFFANYQTQEQLAVFTLFETILVCCITTFYGQDIVTLAMLCTFGIASGLGVYAFTTKNDHTGLYDVLHAGLCCLILMSLLNFFVREHHNSGNTLHMIEMYIGTIFFFGYIIFDVQYFFQDRKKIARYHQNNLHVVAAMNIYLDVVNIFLRLLDIVNKKDRKR